MFAFGIDGGLRARNFALEPCDIGFKLGNAPGRQVLGLGEFVFGFQIFEFHGFSPQHTRQQARLQ